MCEAGVSQSMYLGPTVAAPRTYKFLNSWINCIRNPGVRLTSIGQSFQVFLVSKLQGIPVPSIWALCPLFEAVPIKKSLGPLWIGNIEKIFKWLSSVRTHNMSSVSFTKTWFSDIKINGIIYNVKQSLQRGTSDSQALKIWVRWGKLTPKPLIFVYHEEWNQRKFVSKPYVLINLSFVVKVIDLWWETVTI